MTKKPAATPALRYAVANVIPRERAQARRFAERMYFSALRSPNFYEELNGAELHEMACEYAAAQVTYHYA